MLIYTCLSIQRQGDDTFAPLIVLRSQSLLGHWATSIQSTISLPSMHAYWMTICYIWFWCTGSSLATTWWTLYIDFWADLRVWINSRNPFRSLLRNYWTLDTNFSTIRRNTTLGMCVLKPLNHAERRGFCHFRLTSKKQRDQKWWILSLSFIIFL